LNILAAVSQKQFDCKLVAAGGRWQVFDFDVTEENFRRFNLE